MKGLLTIIKAQKNHLHSQKLTAKAPENGWLEDDRLSFLRRLGIFSGFFAVSFRECNYFFVLMKQKPKKSDLARFFRGH